MLYNTANVKYRDQYKSDPRDTLHVHVALPLQSLLQM